MYTDDDIGKTVTDKNGVAVILKWAADEESCDGCFYDSDSRTTCDPVRDDQGGIGCRMYEFIFCKAEGLRL